MPSEPVATPLGLEEHRRRLHALYDEHVGDVYRYVHRRCGDHALAQDVTQDVFTTVARTVADPGEVTVSWLLRRARFRMIDLIRRDQTYDTKLRIVGAAPDPPDHQASVAERLRVEAALERLSALHRTVLVLHYVDDLSTEQLADHLHRSIKGAEALVTRARSALRTALEDLDG